MLLYDKIFKIEKDADLVIQLPEECLGKEIELCVFNLNDPADVEELKKLKEQHKQSNTEE